MSDTFLAPLIDGPFDGCRVPVACSGTPAMLRIVAEAVPTPTDHERHPHPQRGTLVEALYTQTWYQRDGERRIAYTYTERPQ